MNEGVFATAPHLHLCMPVVPAVPQTHCKFVLLLPTLSARKIELQQKSVADAVLFLGSHTTLTRRGKVLVLVGLLFYRARGLFGFVARLRMRRQFVDAACLTH